MLLTAVHQAPSALVVPAHLAAHGLLTRLLLQSDAEELKQDWIRASSDSTSHADEGLRLLYRSC